MEIRSLDSTLRHLKSTTQTEPAKSAVDCVYYVKGKSRPPSRRAWGSVTAARLKVNPKAGASRVID
jgi:hypothetical protein